MFPIKDNIPTGRFPLVTVALILANVVAYFFLQKHVGTGLSGLNNLDATNVTDWAAIPYEITNPGSECVLRVGDATPVCSGQPVSLPGHPPFWITAFTAMFMHGSLLHLGGNMLFLWIFGNNIEDSMGRFRFIVFYLLGGLAALALQVAISASSTIPTLGASGAIAAILGAYLLLYPRARVLTVIFIILFFTIIELPALVVLGFWFVEQVALGYFDLNGQSGSGGVAYFAHIGGFVFGLLAIRAFAQHVKATPARHTIY
jgi:membrane associated rhomboid family serine protease